MAKKRRRRSTKNPAILGEMSRGHGLGAIRTVREFRNTIDSQIGLDTSERKQLIQQAVVLLEELYTHLPLKKAMHSIDPLQRLRLLEQRIAELTTTVFHAELLDIFIELRDLHTNYSLPAPFGKQVAFLGILVEQYFEDGEPKWMVSKVAEHLVADASLVQGVEITHWNGMQIKQAVWRNADKEAGSNLSARLARGLETLTLRFMQSSFPPDEDWVTITYLSNGEVNETRLDWKVFDSLPELLDGAADVVTLFNDLFVFPLRYHVGVDERRENLRRAQKMLFNRSAVAEERRVRRYKKGAVPKSTADLKSANAIPTSRPDEISARIVDTPDGSFGYLRLWTFHMKDGGINEFLNEFIRIFADEMPKEGVILDVRGNGGGFVIAAEFLLQLLTPSHITPEPSQFIATAGTLDLVQKISNMSEWRESLEQAVSTGAMYSAGIPLSPEDVINSFGQIYFGPLVLVTDAYCYSACDMFAAGFQDHNIGPILGVDEVTGAGGANVLTHADLAQDWTEGPLKSLPGGAGLRVSLRRTLRVGDRAGEPIEDLGVARDEEHQLTRDDLLNGNVDLLAKAGHILADGTPRQFDLDLAIQGGNLVLDLTTHNVESVDVYVDGRPVVANNSVSDGSNSITLPQPPPKSLVQIDGFDAGDLVAARKIRLT